MEPCSKRLSGNGPCVQRILATREPGDGTSRYRIARVYVGAMEPKNFVACEGKRGCHGSHRTARSNQRPSVVCSDQEYDLGDQPNLTTGYQLLRKAGVEMVLVQDGAGTLLWECLHPNNHIAALSHPGAGGGNHKVISGIRVRPYRPAEDGKRVRTMLEGMRL
jgi:hypothetical protein